MNLFRYLIITVLVFVTGCASHYGYRPPIHQLEQGMSKNEALRIMGQPKDRITQGNREGYMYSWDDPWDGRIGAAEEYYVLFVDGKVKQTGALIIGTAAMLGLMRAIDQSPSKAFSE